MFDQVTQLKLFYLVGSLTHQLQKLNEHVGTVSSCTIHPNKYFYSNNVFVPFNTTVEYPPLIHNHFLYAVNNNQWGLYRAICKKFIDFTFASLSPNHTPSAQFVSYISHHLFPGLSQTTGQL